ncbi:Peroxidase protein [Dioscorea alata]|uniref:Peroxidase protein n=1 Tax=Dioscorea alata TaxID=55571 RepID=A0ACB7V354_DIOAL|nr:Peroxidase protein [Dioscorea alata]
MNKRMVLGSRAHSLFLLFSLFLCFFSFVNGELRLNFYSESCPQAEDIVKEEVEKLYHKHGNTAVSWVRNLFHDCMVKSCDASLLLEETSSTISEQNSPRSFGMRNFKYVKVIKDALEKECPNTVSCADIVALSAREGVVMLKGPYIDMRTGRRDSKESYSQDVINSIPNHNDSLSFILSRFQSIGINAEGTTALLGAHSVGRVHCINVVGRLYPTVDPSIDPIYAEYLKGRCPSPEPDPKAVLYARNDRDTPMIIDNMYYKNLLKHKGLMLVDQQLVTDPSTSQFVEKMAVDNDYFYEKFTEALLLMSENNPVTGDEGEIRKDCRFVN